MAEWIAPVAAGFAVFLLVAAVLWPRSVRIKFKNWEIPNLTDDMHRAAETIRRVSETPS